MARTEDYGLGEFSFPRGWFMVADAAELKDRPLAVRFFGQDLALYRGKSGRVIMLEAYCPHMGAHLARNSTSYVTQDGPIEGDSLRCPNHAWRFGPEGQCDHIPYYDGRIPKAACVKSWRVVERMGCIWAWHDAEGGAPDYEVPLFEEWNDPSWVQWKIDQMGVLQLHPVEVVDNMADVAHLGPVHGSTVQYFENEFSGHVVVQRQGCGHRTLATSSSLLETDTWYTGPAILYSRMTGLHDTIVLIAHTPIDDGTLKVWHALLMKSNNAVATAQDVTMAREYQESSRLSFMQDFDIWANKRPCINILQVQTDGPFHKVRQWYGQFYNQRARASESHRQLDGIHTVKGMPAAPKGVAT